MTYIFEPVGDSATGSLTTTALGATAMPTNALGQYVRVANFGTDAFWLQFGSSSVSVSGTNKYLILPGVETLKINVSGRYFNAATLTGTATFSITAGNIL
jgi:hypothetical protein